MIIISTREFRDNQKKYFDLADNNEQIIVQRGKSKSYKLVPIIQGETLMSEQAFFEKIDDSIKQFQKGKVKRVDNLQDFEKLLDL
jgi:antitoxin YefM